MLYDFKDHALKEKERKKTRQKKTTNIIPRGINMQTVLNLDSKYLQ